MFNIREVTSADAAAICKIQNHYIATSSATFTETPYTNYGMTEKIQSLQRLQYPFLVAVNEQNELIGFSYLSKFREQSAYKIAESSIYVAPANRSHGIGKMLYRQLIAQARRSGKYSGILAVITADNLPSISFHKNFNFIECGRIEQAGFKLNQWHAVVFMRLALDNDFRP